MIVVSMGTGTSLVKCEGDDIQHIGGTGIGGGIYLAPVLHLFRLAEAKTVAATCSLFILVNSLAGLAGQLAKPGQSAAELFNVSFVALPLAVASV